MWKISITATYNDGSKKSGIALKDRAGFRYFGDSFNLANADLSDIVKSQDMIYDAYNASVTFRELCIYIATALGWTLNPPVSSVGLVFITDLVFSVTFLDPVQLCFVGTTDSLLLNNTTGSWAVVSDMACVYDGINADTDLTNVFNSIIV